MEKKIGLGVDIERISSILNLMNKYSYKELSILFHDLEYYNSFFWSSRLLYLSICFSAKESVFKAVRKFFNIKLVDIIIYPITNGSFLTLNHNINILGFWSVVNGFIITICVFSEIG